MTAILTKDKLITTPDSNIFSYINNRNYVKDPKSPAGANNRPFVYKSDPFIKSSNFRGFPYIVVESPRMEYNSVSANGKVKTIEWKQVITVITSSDGAMVNIGSDAGETNMNDILDDLLELFNNETRKQELRELRLFSMDLKIVNTDDIILKDKTLHSSELELTYKERFTVSS